VHAYVHIQVVIMMRYLISQVWREQNTEIDVHLFDNANDNRIKKQAGINKK